MCIYIQLHSNREKKRIKSRTRYKEKRKMDDGEKQKDGHPQRIPMTITGCPKCHLTINGSMRRRNSNLSVELDRNGIRDCEDLCREFSGRRTRRTKKKDDGASGAERWIMMPDANQSIENTDRFTIRSDFVVTSLTRLELTFHRM